MNDKARVRDITLVLLAVTLVASLVFASMTYLDLGEARRKEQQSRMRLLSEILRMSADALTYAAYGAENYGKLGDPNATRVYIQVNLYHASRYLELALTLEPHLPRDYREALAGMKPVITDLGILLSTLYNSMLKDPNITLTFLHRHSDTLNSIASSLHRVASDYIALSQATEPKPAPSEVSQHLNDLRYYVNTLSTLAEYYGES